MDQLKAGAHRDPLNRDHDAVDESRQTGQPGAIWETLQGNREVGSGASIGEAPASLGRVLGWTSSEQE